jgi:hypothetical protein
MKAHMLQNWHKRASTLLYDLTFGISACELQRLQTATYTLIPEALASNDERWHVEMTLKDDRLTEDKQSASLMTSAPSNRCNAT